MSRAIPAKKVYKLIPPYNINECVFKNNYKRQEGLKGGFWTEKLFSNIIMSLT